MKTTKTALTILLMPLVAGLAACSGAAPADVVVETTDATQSGAPETPRPSSSWEIGHAIGMAATGGTGGLPFSIHDYSTDEPLADATLCNLGGGIHCTSTDDAGWTVVPAAGGSTLLALNHPGYVPSFATVSGTSGAAGERRVALYTPEGLDLVYTRAGLERDEQSATLLVRVDDCATAGVTAELFSLEGAEPVPEAIYTNGEGAMTETATAGGAVYFLGVESGEYGVRFTTGGACTAVPSTAWIAGGSEGIETMAEAGTVTFAGAIACK